MQIMFHVLRGVFAFARVLIDKEPLVYPTKLKITSNIFVLIQKLNNKHASKFINTVANCFAEDAINHPDDEEIFLLKD